MLGALYDWLLFVHILAAMLWLGGAAVMAVLAGRVLKSGDDTEVARFVGSLRIVGPVLFAPAPVVLLGAGIWMVVRDWNFSDRWIGFGLTLLALSLVVGAGFQSRAAIGAERAAKAGDEAAARALLRRWSWGARLIVLLLVIATWDMVVKPTL